MKANLENKLIAVIRVRGSMGVRKEISETMKRLNLNRVNNLIFLLGNKSNIGMIKKCNDYVTFGEVSKEALGRVLERKEMKASKEDLDSALDGKKRFRDVVGTIRLKPPKHGYEGAKQSYSNGGALGYRGEAINELIKRMT